MPLPDPFEAVLQRFPQVRLHVRTYQSTATATLDAHDAPLTFGEGQTLLRYLALTDWAVRQVDWRCRYPRQVELRAVELIHWLPVEGAA